MNPALCEQPSPGEMHPTDRWMVEVRDPAEQSQEGGRVIAHGDASISYWLAPVPGGCWSWRVDATDRCRGESSPWATPVPTREDALQLALRRMRDVMERFSRDDGRSSGSPKDCRRIQELLADGLFGFMEPDPEPS